MLTFLLLSILFIYILVQVKYNPIKAIIAIIVAYFFIPFISVRAGSILGEYTGVILQSSVLFAFLVYVIISKRFAKLFSHTLFVYLIIAHVYFTLSAVIKDVDIVNYLNEFRRYLNNIVILLFVLISGISINLVEKKIKRIFLLLFLVESVIALLMYFGPSEIYNYFSVMESTNISGITTTGKLVMGTLLAPNNFANTMVLLFFVILYLLSKEQNNKNKTRIYYLLIIAIFITVLVSGIRTSLFSLLIGFAIYLLVFKGKQGVLFLGIALVLIFSMNIASMSSNFKDYSKRGNTALERMLGATVVFQGTKNMYKYQESNIWLSMLVLEYFPDNMIIGSNRYYKAGYGIIKDGNKNSTDVTLALILTEYGIIGFLLYLFPFIFILTYLYRNNEKKEFTFNMIMFVVLLSQSVSDKGLFLNYANIIYFLISGLQMNIIINKQLQIINK